ncbi:MAG TPA: serine hydroxymethyltransferase [Candidatus Angelobacter sp.]|nr:serine hydroxymethyltransferase [Candidatus Angelobacter sp.]
MQYSAFSTKASSILAELFHAGMRRLADDDPVVLGLIYQEYCRQLNTLSLVAASSVADPSVLLCEGSVFSNITTEGYPNHRFHGGCEFADPVEELAIDNAKTAFGARYANVQPHSGSSANEIVLFSMLKPGDRVLGLDLKSGGHLTHGARASVSGQYFEALTYGLDNNCLIDYTQVRDIALRQRPKIIVCGASAYPRVIDFKVFREIADESNALVLADISHIAGIVAGGSHPNPIDHAHFTTMSTYKQLYGPRGGLILMGRDYDQRLPGKKQTLSEMIQKGVFPLVQGTPNISQILAKARALALAASPEFKRLASRIVADAKALAAEMAARGYAVVTGGTDNHIVLLDLTRKKLGGLVAQRALEDCRVIVNKNLVPGDSKGPSVTSGIRLGTNTVALRGMDTHVMRNCAAVIDKVLSSVEARGDMEYHLPHPISEVVQSEVAQLCSRYPIPAYPADSSANSKAETADNSRTAHFPAPEHHDSPPLSAARETS